MDLRQIFIALQNKMAATLEAHRLVSGNTVAKGTASELQWRAMLGQYLPERYCVTEGFVLDSQGSISDQLDIIVYDRHFSPLLFDEDGMRYVPAESVYAIFEVKAHIDAGNLVYAGEKAASVRRLQRTSAPIPHAGGRFKPKKPQRILAGVLSLDTRWSPRHDRAFKKIFMRMEPDARLDLGCVLNDRSFVVTYADGVAPKVQLSEPKIALIFFFLHLLGRLQAMGTVAAMDYEKYACALRKPG